jgi:hypothetical protein
LVSEPDNNLEIKIANTTAIPREQWEILHELVKRRLLVAKDAKTSWLNCINYYKFDEMNVMAHPVIDEDWSDYDDRKIKEQKNSSKFSCEDRWEIEYLADKLKKHYPQKSHKLILQAISNCCLKSGAPHTREVFIECVTSNL